MITPEFLLTSLVVVLIPGTGVIYTVSTGLFLGGRASLAAAVGCTLGIVPHLVASILGLSAILNLSAQAFIVIKYVGAAYLLYMAWGLWRDRSALALEGKTDRQSQLRIINRGVWINLLNPKLTVFFLSFLPLFVDPTAAAPLSQLIQLSGIFMLMTLVVFIVYGQIAQGFRQWVIGSPRLFERIRRGFALTFAALGVKLALMER